MDGAIEVVAAVICDRGQVLTCRRRREKAAGGKWEFPGGKVEPGESPSEALLREIAEELGVSIRIRDELTRGDTRVGDRLIRLTCFRAELRGRRPLASTDHDHLTWLKAEQLSALDWAEPDLPAVRALIESVRHS